MLLPIYMYLLSLRLLFSSYTSTQKIFKWLDNIEYITHKFMGWQNKTVLLNDNYKLLNINPDIYKNNNKILLLSNHVNLCDMFSILFMVRKYYPEHKIIGIAKLYFETIPIIGNFLKNNVILIDNGNHNNETKIDKQIETLTKNGKSIVILFPEGTTYYDKSIQKSNEWCKKDNIKPFLNSLAPRIKGIQYILKYYQPDIILLNHLIYLDDHLHNKAVYYSHFLTHNLPKQSINYIKDITSLKEHYNISLTKKSELYFKDYFYKLWYQLDNFLFHTNRQFFIDY